MKKTQKKNEKGFTLVELLIVVAIIGILAAIAIPQFNNYKKKSYCSALVSDAKNAYTAAQVFLQNPSNTSVGSVDDLRAGGYQSTNGVSLQITTNMNMNQGLFTLTHSKLSSTDTVTVDYNGNIQKNGICAQ